ncbi:hypothetical protein ZWY2020_013416 [Hordeum vulgare]|nr:hypothetical protein ZWY2020_013416 [Hordeum vulgare]
MPWEGYNFEDAVLISERLVYEDIYTSFHIRKYEIQTDTTSQGSTEKITKEIPHLEEHVLRNLDKNGVVRLGSWVETGDILVGKLTPQIASESSYIAEAGLLRAIFGLEVSTSKAPINTAVDMGPLRIRLLNDQWLTAVLWSGFARIVNNEIIILGNDAELGSDIDPEEAQKALEIAEANLSKAEGTKDLVEAKLALRRARIRIEAVNWIPPSN